MTRTGVECRTRVIESPPTECENYVSTNRVTRVTQEGEASDQPLLRTEKPVESGCQSASELQN